MKYTSVSIIRHALLMGILMMLTISHSFSQESATTHLPPERPPIRYLVDVDSDGVYEIVQVEKAPIPIQGIEKFSSELSSMIKYPAMAVEENISGVVILNVSIDQEGKVTRVDIKQSLRQDCDDAAIKAFKGITTHGYAPLIYEGSPVKYQMEIPILFWLG